MSSILFDPAVIASVVVAVLATAAALLCSRVASVMIPTTAVCCGAIIAAVPLADFDIGRYGPSALTPYPAWMIGVLVIAVVVTVASAARRWDGGESSAHLTVALAAGACALFLFIPETDLVRVTPGPLVVVAIAVVFLGLPPIGRLGLGAVGAGLVWVSLVDGATRPGTVLATSAVLGLVSFAPRLGVGRSGPARDVSPPHVRTGRHVAGLAVGIVVVGRVLGTTTSWFNSWAAVSIVAFAAVTAVAEIRSSER